MTSCVLVHFQLRTWSMPLFGPCRADTPAVTADPAAVTCPVCLQGLRHLACFIHSWQMLPLSALSP